MESGPIVLIEDDADDKNIFQSILNDLGVKNKLIWFDRSQDAYQYLQTTADQPFIIMCDINLPKQNGIEFKLQIDNDPELRKKCIPFLFYSTSVDQASVDKAYLEMTVQGFFQKGNDFHEIKNNMKIILDYWKYCRHPNS